MKTKKTAEEMKAAIIQGLEKLSPDALSVIFKKICPHSEIRSKLTKARKGDEPNELGSAICCDCESDLGEYCDKSPRKVCEYEHDFCRHCDRLDPWEDK